MPRQTSSVPTPASSSLSLLHPPPPPPCTATSSAQTTSSAQRNAMHDAMPCNAMITTTLTAMPDKATSCHASSAKATSATPAVSAKATTTTATTTSHRLQSAPQVMTRLQPHHSVTTTPVTICMTSSAPAQLTTARQTTTPPQPLPCHAQPYRHVATTATPRRATQCHVTITNAMPRQVDDQLHTPDHHTAPQPHQPRPCHALQCHCYYSQAPPLRNATSSATTRP